MNRRALLKLAPVALAAGAVPALSGEILPPIMENPIAVMHREITALQTILNGENDMTDAEADRMCDRMMELADAIAELPARNADDMLRKILGQTVNGDHDVGDGPRAEAIWAEARALVA